MTSILAVRFGERHPRSVELEHGRVFELRLMSRADRHKVIDFGRPRGDVPSLAVDITDPEAIDQWISEIESGRATTILALEDGAVVAYASLHRDGALWKQYAGEVQMMVARSCRSVGLAERMVAEVVVIANGLGLKRVTTGVAADRKSSIAMYERVGFQPEALLTDYLIDPWDKTHDLVIMSCDVARASAAHLAEESALVNARCVEPPAVTFPVQQESEAVAAFIEIYAPAVASGGPVEEAAIGMETVPLDSDAVAPTVEVRILPAASVDPAEEPAIAVEIDPAESDAVAAYIEMHAPAVVGARREEPALAAAAAMRAVDALAAFAENDASTEAAVRPVAASVIVVEGPTEAGVVAAFADRFAPAQIAQTTADDQARVVRLAGGGGTHAWRVHLMDSGLLRAVAAIAVFAAVSSAAVTGTLYALESRGGGNESHVLSTTERPLLEVGDLPPASFTGSHVGSGRLVIPASAPQVSLRVSLDAATVTGTWFWCFESSFGLSWQEHYCSATAIVDEQMDELLTQGNVRIDPAWPADAVYFIQMYCESECAWQTEVRQQ